MTGVGPICVGNRLLSMTKLSALEVGGDDMALIHEDFVFFESFTLHLYLKEEFMHL